MDLWGPWLLWARSGRWLRHFPLCLPVPWGRWLLCFRGLPLDLQSRMLRWDPWGLLSRPLRWGRSGLGLRMLPLDQWDLSDLSGLPGLCFPGGQTLRWDLWGRSIPNSSCHGSS